MKGFKIVWMALVVALGVGPMCAWMGARAAAQAFGTVTGEVRDPDGKPFPDVVLVFKNQEQGQTYEVRTDRNGKFQQGAVRTGIYIVSVKVKDKVIYETNTRVTGGQEATVNLNFKELIAKQGAESAEAAKKQEEEKKGFEAMKTHFDTGIAALDQARQVRDDLQRRPADQRAPLQAKLGDLAGTAVNELQAAEKGLKENDSNRHIILAKLGEAYDAAGKNQEAADAYQQAITLKPDVAGYYNNLGNALARLGKVEEAGKAYEKSATLDPVNAPRAYRNFGIVLYNAGKMKEATEPLKKATELDPKNAQAWYLLGSALVNQMGSKQEGDKMILVLQPGTVEAYEKAVELDPNGTYGAQAKQGLQSLEQMGLGIQTKVKSRTKK